MNIPLLQILDAVKAVKIIPDATSDETIRRLITLIGELSPKDTNLLAVLAEKYTPQTRSMTGAIIELQGYAELAKKLKMTLHPSTTYKIGVSGNVLPNRRNWNIV